MLLFFGSACGSSAVLSQTDAELRKKLEILEGRIMELEGRLDRARGHAESEELHAAKNPSRGVVPAESHIAPSHSPAIVFVPAPTGVEGKPQTLKKKVADVEGHPEKEGWDSASSGGHGHGFDSKKFHGGVTLKQDAFFGFQTILDAGYEITDHIDFTFYSWLWTSPNFGRSRVISGPDGTQVDAGGNGLWTEVGMGLNFHFFNDALSINPQIGILNGALLSSQVVGRGIRAAEGVVPSLTINYDDDHFTGQAYFAYYAAIRDERARDFIHNWVNVGVKPALFNLKNIPVNSVGVHWEHLRFHVDRIDGNPGTLYNWIGPYVELALPLHLALRFAAGADLKGDVADEFYQASIKMHF